MALLGTYSSQHLKKYGTKPLLNLNTEQWAADAVIESFGLDLSMKLVYRYFEVAEKHSWTFYAYNAEKILQAMDDEERDKRERKERRQKAKEWLSE